MIDTNKIDQYLAAKGWSDSYLSKMATGNTRAVENIRSGKASVATYDAVMAYIRENPVRKKGARK